MVYAFDSPENAVVRGASSLGLGDLLAQRVLAPTLPAKPLCQGVENGNTLAARADARLPRVRPSNVGRWRASLSHRQCPDLVLG